MDLKGELFVKEKRIEGAQKLDSQRNPILMQGSRIKSIPVLSQRTFGY
jgi:hypothetical protein